LTANSPGLIYSIPGWFVCFLSLSLFSQKKNLGVDSGKETTVASADLPMGHVIIDSVWLEHTVALPTFYFVAMAIFMVVKYGI
jgi:hypothetical protein